MLGTHVRPDGRVRFLYHHGNASEVAVAGNFSDWQPVGLSPQGEGWWGAELGPLSEGDVFYKFVTPFGWHLDQYNYRKSADGEASYLSVGGHAGHLLRRGFHSPALGRGKNYLAYLPPAYATTPWRAFPVLYLMGGLFESETGWVDRASLEDTLDGLIGGGQIDDMIVVMPDKDDAVFHNEQWGAYLGYLAGDLPAHVESEYRTLPLRAAEGLSLGAGWAVRLGLSMPERYCSVSGLSGHFGQEFYSLAREHRERVAAAGVRFRIACGNGEGQVISDNAAFSGFLKEIGLSSEFHVNEGPHDWPLWVGQIGHSLRFHDYGFKNR